MRRARVAYGIAVVGILWYAAHLALNTPAVPGPLSTVSTFVRLIPKGLLVHAGVSLLRIVVAVAVCLAVGVPAGLLMGRRSRIDSILAPIAYILYPIPKIAFLPVFMLLFGLGNVAKIILIVTIVFFQILLATRDGVKEIPRTLHYSVAALGLTSPQIYRHLILPAVLPKIISSLRVTTGISISVLFFAENFATRFGLGYFVMNAWAMVDYSGMFAGIFALGLMGLLLFLLLDLLERALCPWLFATDQLPRGTGKSTI